MVQTEEIMVEIKKYRDYSIQVNDNGYFITALDGEPTNATTLRSLEEKIDDFLRVQAKQITVDLPVLDDEGASCRIIGVHLGSGGVITRPSGARGPFVVDVQDNSDLVAKVIRDSHEVDKLRLKLKDRSVIARFGYGRITSDEYPVKMRQLQNSYDNAVAITKEGANAQ